MARSRSLGQHIRFRVKQNCCCPRSQSITFFYTPSFFQQQKITLSTHISIRCFQYPPPSSPRIGTTSWHCDVNTMRLIELMNIRPSVNSSKAGNESMNCWPVNWRVLQLIWFLWLTAKMLYIYCIAFIWEKKWWCITICFHIHHNFSLYEINTINTQHFGHWKISLFVASLFYLPVNSSSNFCPLSNCLPMPSYAFPNKKIL